MDQRVTGDSDEAGEDFDPGETALFAVHDSADVMATAAALQLEPANADLLLPLQRLVVRAAIAGTSTTGRSLSTSTIKRLYAAPSVTDPHVMMMVDPFETPLGVEVALWGRTWLLRQGLVGTAYDLTLAFEAVEFLRGYLDDSDALWEALEVSRVLVYLSDSISRSQGLRGTTFSPVVYDRKLTIPPAQRLAHLKTGLTFDLGALRAQFGQAAVEALEVFGCPLGNLDPELLRDTEAPTDELIRRPLLIEGNQLVVIAPTELIASSLLAVQDAVLASGVSAEFAHALHQASLARLDVDLRLLQAEEIGRPTELYGATASFRRLNFADDKRLDIVLISDDLRGREADEITGQWSVQPLVDRAVELLDSDGAPHSSDSSTLRMVVLAGAGRFCAYGISELRRSGPFLQCNLEDFHWLALEFVDDPLRLWRFASAYTTLVGATRLVSTNILDTLATYLDQRDSFYLGDDEPPSTLLVAPGDGVAVRRSITERRGNFPVFDPYSAGRPSLALTAHGDAGLPIYRLLGSSSWLVVHVRLSGTALWIGGDAASPQGREFMSHAIDAVAYWTWRIAEADPAVWTDASRDNLWIEVQFADEAGFLTALADGGALTRPPDGPWISHTPVASPPELTAASVLKIDANNVSRLVDEHNASDRDICAALLDLVASRLGCRPNIEPGDLVATGGPRYLEFQDVAATLKFPPVRPARLVTAHMQSETADLVGSVGRAKYSPGTVVPEDQRVDFLNALVEQLFVELKGQVAALSPDGLLAALIEFDEALLQEAREVLPARERHLAFFPGVPSVDALFDQAKRLTESSRASRFLIEYATAVPPTGTANLSEDRYDRLLAIAAQIIQLGFRSDALHYGLTDVPVVILKSGRLNLGERDEYHDAVERQHRVLMVDTLVGHTHASARADAEAIETVDAALENEVGVTLTKLHLALSALVAANLDNGGLPIVDKPLDEVHELLRDVGRLTETEVAAAIRALSLEPLADFLAEPIDVLPWRYGRPRTYLARPLLIDPVGGEGRASWGPERVVAAISFWREVLSSGRYRAQSKELRAALGPIRGASTRAFERRVESMLRAAGAAATDCGVKKFGSHRIVTTAGDDLGDVDAIGAWPRSKLLVVAETKDFELDRTPSETRNKALDVVLGENSVVARHDRRTAWVASHLAPVMKHLGLPTPSGGWRVVPVIVTSRPLALLETSVDGVAIVRATEFGEWLARQQRKR